MRISKKYASKLLACIAITALLVFSLGALSGCGDDNGDKVDSDNGNAELLSITLAAVPSDDLLPLWIAEDAGIIADLGLDLEIITFASGREMMAALTANEAQGGTLAMLSIAQMDEGGIPAQAVMRLAPSRGAVVSSPESGITQASQLAGIPVAASEASLEEYILYRSLTEAGIPEDDIVLEVVPDLRARPQLLMAEQIQASTMPWTLASALGQQGAHILVTEKDIEDFTSTVLGIRSDWLAQDGAAETVALIWEAWNQGVELVNADPDSYLDLLVEKANLPEESIAGGYDMQTYAPAQMPDRQQVEGILQWAYRKGYIESVIDYDDFAFEH